MAHVAILPHVLAIRLDTIEDSLPVRRGREAVCTPAENNAGGKSLDIPFPGTGERLVKVIHIEDLIAFRGGVDAKVVEMRVATDLHLDPSDRSCSHILRHDDRRPAQKGKRRGCHALIAKRHEMCQAGAVLFLQQTERIRAISSRGPPGMDGARYLVTKLPASSTTTG